VPAAVSAVRDLFEVESVPELGPLEPGVAPPYEGRVVAATDVQASVPFRVRPISSLGTPDEARVRDDVAGGMVTLVYRSGGIVLTQWRTSDVRSRIALVPTAGRAEDVAVGDRPALWVEGAARGTFTLTGADGAVHRETFEASPGVLLWRDDGTTFLLQGAGTRAASVDFASRVDR